ncbi:Os10g0437550, partial [Oryza sativa Japonica Group]
GRATNGRERHDDRWQGEPGSPPCHLLVATLLFRLRAPSPCCRLREEGPGAAPDPRRHRRPPRSVSSSLPREEGPDAAPDPCRRRRPPRSASSSPAERGRARRHSRPPLSSLRLLIAGATTATTTTARKALSSTPPFYYAHGVM